MADGVDTAALRSRFATAVGLVLVSAAFGTVAFHRPWCSGDSVEICVVPGSFNDSPEIDVVTFDLPPTGSTPVVRVRRRLPVEDGWSGWLVGEGLVPSTLQRRGGSLRVPTSPREVWDGPLNASAFIAGGPLPGARVGHAGAPYWIAPTFSGDPTDRYHGLMPYFPPEARWGRDRGNTITLVIAAESASPLPAELSWDHVGELVREDVARVTREIVDARQGKSFAEREQELAGLAGSLVEFALLFDVSLGELSDVLNRLSSELAEAAGDDFSYSHPALQHVAWGASRADSLQRNRQHDSAVIGETWTYGPRLSNRGLPESAWQWMFERESHWAHGRPSVREALDSGDLAHDVPPARVVDEDPLSRVRREGVRWLVLWAGASAAALAVLLRRRVDGIVRAAWTRVAICGLLACAAIETAFLGPARVADVAMACAAMVAGRRLGRAVPALFVGAAGLSVLAVVVPSALIDVAARAVAFVAACLVAHGACALPRRASDDLPRRPCGPGFGMIVVPSALALPLLLLGCHVWWRSNVHGADALLRWSLDGTDVQIALWIGTAATAGWYWAAQRRRGVRRAKPDALTTIAMALGASAHVVMLALACTGGAAWGFDNPQAWRQIEFPVIDPIEVGSVASLVVLAITLVRSIVTLIGEPRAAPSNASAAGALRVFVDA